ncbi:hypothetical protein AVEN_149279-1 [Araneus ventricosus]|uniref:Uncharacterized protein n=1 Tax=Araneus ventricosus TaxID=182803 RepID=A0A4Y2KU67_ARAVE|nr:hypothetical protein AVEN_149279-1 [Araneus ventricosus]
MVGFLLFEITRFEVARRTNEDGHRNYKPRSDDDTNYRISSAGRHLTLDCGFNVAIATYTGGLWRNLSFELGKLRSRNRYFTTEPPRLSLSRCCSR